jgi:hypothetical protein
MKIMPGFAAEASLYKTSRGYRGRVGSVSVAVANVSLAQIEPEPMCLPRDLGCLPDPTSSTGCRRFRQDIFCNEVPGLPCPCPPPAPVCGQCVVIVPPLQPGQPLDPASLRFVRECVGQNGRFTVPCTRCGEETRIELPFPISDRCVRVCCTSLDPASCSASVREC